MKNSSRQKLFPTIICLLGFVLNLIAYYPGFLSPDSLEQYRESVSGAYTDWHPPVMAFFWRLLNHIHRGPGVMLAFQLSCLWFSVFYLIVSLRNKLWKVLIFLLAFMPFVQNFAGYIIKDTQMAFSWMLAFAIMFNAAVNNRGLKITGAIFCAFLLLYGTWVRPNALPGLLPLAIFWAYACFPDYTGKRKWLTGIALIFLVVAGQAAFTSMLNPKKTYAGSKLFMHDLTGIFVETGENVFPSFLYTNQGFDTFYLRQKYTPATFDNIWWNPDNKIILAENNETVAAALQTAWINSIKNHPGIYLQNRWDGFIYFLRIKNREDNFMYLFRWMQPNDLGLEFKENALTNIFLKPVEHQKDMPYMRPWFWVLLNLLLCVCMPFVKRTIYARAYMTLVLSSLFYLLPQYFIFQTDTDFRYFYWNCIACTLALFILVIPKSEKNIHQATTSP